MEEKEEIRERMKRFLEQKGMSVPVLASRMGVQRSSIAHILSGRNKPSYDLIRRFLEAFPEIRAEWFILGKGEMFKTPVQETLFESTDLSIHSKQSEKEEPENIEVTDVDMLEKKKEKQENVEDISIKGKSNVRKIILLFENGTFQAYDPEEPQ